MATVINRDAATGRNIGHDLTGRRSGMLTIVGPTEERCPNGYKIWIARCDCGEVIKRSSYSFSRGTKSCGCGRGRTPIPDQGSHVNALYHNCRRAAIDRGYVFELSKSELRALVEMPCHYCGTPPSATYTHGNLSGVYHHGGIDRADNSVGYVLSNCVPCCKRCNIGKGVMNADEFRQWIKQVHDHLGL